MPLTRPLPCSKSPHSGPVRALHMPLTRPLPCSKSLHSGPVRALHMPRAAQMEAGAHEQRGLHASSPAWGAAAHRAAPPLENSILPPIFRGRFRRRGHEGGPHDRVCGSSGRERAAGVQLCGSGCTPERVPGRAGV
eukprot:6740370-Pyramimonas_sp.AAC.1